MRKVLTLLIALSLVSVGFSSVNVTFSVNTSTIEGATDSTITMQVRGNTAPLTWDNTSVTATNVGGDYWSVVVAFDDSYIGNTIEYKFAYIDNITSGDVWEDGGNRSFVLASTDMVLDLAYFSNGNTPPYTPTDNVDVFFRVNTAGILDYAGETMGVRGGTAPLDWGSTTALTREGTESDYWSGVVSFDPSLVGTTVEYKFVKGDGPDWESVPNRTFTLNVDTTLAFKYWNDQPPITSVDTFLVTFIVNTATLDNYTDSTVTGFVTGSYDGWNHYNDTLTVRGDYSSRTIPMVGSSSGVSFEYKYLYKDGIGNDHWESVANRQVTVSSDTTLFSWWDNTAPFVPTDSVDVWFRVNMSGVAGFTTDQEVGLRGAAPLDWGVTYPLTQEGDSYYYSGLVSFPNSMIGQTAEYKFVWGPDPNWEDQVPNRTFTVNVDTTLAFKYFNDKPPTGQEPVEAYVYFNCEMAAYEALGILSVARDDSVQVRGGFNGWNDSDPLNSKMTRIPGSTIYELLAPITDFPGNKIEYKYFLKLSQESLDYFASIGADYIEDWWGWEVPPIRGGGNREFTFEGNPDNIQEIGVEGYQGLPLAGIIPEGTTITVTFNMDMTNAPLFNPATDTLYFIFQDAWAEHLAGYVDSSLVYSDTDGDGIYTLTFDYTGPVPYSFVYTTKFVGPENELEEGGGYAYGRFRCRYIQPTSTDPVTWPSEYTFPTDVFTQDPPLVVEDPPLSITDIDLPNRNVPETFSLEQNYPNPFNPKTTIAFSIPASDIVHLRIYNLLGQSVRHVVYYGLPAGRYTYTWNGKDARGNSVSSGVYFYELQVGDKFRSTKKMILMK